MNILVFLVIVYGSHNDTCEAAALCTEDRAHCEVAIESLCEMTFAECVEAQVVEMRDDTYPQNFYTVFGCENTRKPKNLSAGVE